MELLRNKRLQVVLVLFIPAILYFNTLSHGFILDDDVVIVKNTFVGKGISGIPEIFSHDSFRGYELIQDDTSLLQGGRYRPLSLAAFALLIEIFGPKPLPFHFLNIVLYVLTGAMLYWFLHILFEGKGGKCFFSLFISMLFIAHPVHTEVVANVKSADEQLAMLFGLLALIFLIKPGKKHQGTRSFIAGIFFFLACLGKESVFPLVALAPLMFWFFRESTLLQSVRSALPVIVAGAGYLILRFIVLGSDTSGQVMDDPLNNPFLTWKGNTWVEADPITRIATVLYIFGLDLRLLIWPHPLTHDYYPFHITLKDFSSPAVWLSTLGLLILILYSVRSLIRREAGGFGVIWLLIAMSITLNVFFPVGTFLAERFLYFPSLGFCIAVVWLGKRIFTDSLRPAGIVVFTGVIIVFAILTILRNPAWESNITLKQTDIKTSVKSVKLHNDLGTILLDSALVSKDSTSRRKLLEKAYNHLKQSIQEHPTYFDAWLAFGAASFYLEKFNESAEAYLNARSLAPDDPKANLGLFYALRASSEDLLRKGNYKEAEHAIERALDIQYDSALAKRLELVRDSL